jgi:hypothetical protein
VWAEAEATTTRDAAPSDRAGEVVGQTVETFSLFQQNKGDMIRFAAINLKRLPKINAGVRQADLAADIREATSEASTRASERRRISLGIWLSTICLGDMSNGPTSPNTLVLERSAIYRTGKPFRKNRNEQTDHLDVWNSY